MKKIITLFGLLLLLTNCEKPGDCVKSTGPMASKVFIGFAFTKILVNKGISVVIKQGDEKKVEIRAGENLINDIEVDVKGDMLRLSDNTTCNWTREYGATVVYITVPNLTDIYCKTEKRIISDGILSFPNLRLVSMDSYDGFPSIGTGDFVLQLQTENLTIDNNNVSHYFLTGSANTMNVSFYQSDGVFHGESLRANTIKVYHRGTNDVVLHPLNAIRGGIFNIGNVICVNRPPVVEVARHYRGQLVFY